MSAQNRLFRKIKKPLKSSLLIDARTRCEARLARNNLHRIQICQRDESGGRFRFAAFLNDQETHNALQLARGEGEKKNYISIEIVAARQFLIDYNRQNKSHLEVSRVEDKYLQMLLVLDYLTPRDSAPTSKSEIEQHILNLMTHFGIPEKIMDGFTEGSFLDRITDALTFQLWHLEQTELKRVGTGRAQLPEVLVSDEERAAMREAEDEFDRDMRALIEDTRPPQS